MKFVSFRHLRLLLSFWILPIVLLILAYVLRSVEIFVKLWRPSFIKMLHGRCKSHLVCIIVCIDATSDHGCQRASQRTYVCCSLHLFLFTRNSLTVVIIRKWMPHKDYWLLTGQIRLPIFLTPNDLSKRWMQLASFPGCSLLITASKKVIEKI